MLEFDESEYKQSVMSDEELILVTLFCGIETHDMLLYEGDEHYRLIGITPSDAIGRAELGQRDSYNTSNCEAKGQSA